MKQELPPNATEKIDNLLRDLVLSSGFDLLYTFKANDVSPGAVEATTALETTAPTTETTASANSSTGRIVVEFTGPDTTLLTARNGELLHALEHLAAKVLRLESEDHDRISFDADSYKANRDRDLRRAAAEAIDSVRATSKPYSFPPMTSRERRLLHLALVESGLPTASTGDGPRRFVVLYPLGYEPQTASQQTPNRNGNDRDPRGSSGDRTNAIRSSFRRR